MQNNSQNPANVVSLFGSARKAEKPEPQVEEQKLESPEAVDSLRDAMRRNDELRKKLADERAKANRSVLKSYRIKH